MTLKHLLTFVTVAKTLSTTKAAELLYTSQPAVSLSISQLEHHYKIKLFRRVNNRLKLSVDGEKLLSYAKRVIDDFNHFEMVATTTSNIKNFKIGVSSYFSNKTILDLLKYVDDDINIQLVTDSFATVQNKILSGEFDIAIVHAAFHLDKLKTLTTIQDNLILVANKKYQSKIEDPLDIINFPLLLPDISTEQRKTFEYHLSNYMVKINPRLETNDFDTLVKAAISGYGIALVNESMVRDEIKSGLLKIVNVGDLVFNQFVFIISSIDFKHNVALDRILKKINLILTK